ncbi:hypothetical protein WG901_13005 [Novosphingobium sp. PS1R-30]|uniref:Glycosyltransferase RgtA/B/C/D-like domain-containing protein n=1 Tax=Novosphingobium anseongense TaxID=3133436 RepID=A0ABU8RX18_9SPHN
MEWGSSPKPERSTSGRAGYPLFRALGHIASFSLIAFVIVQQIFAIWITLTLDPFEWVEFFQDDAYYYLGIARNMAEHGISAFSLPIETNGYQPLWLMILSIAAKIVEGDRVLLVVLTHALELAAIIGFMVLSRRHYGCAWPAALAILLFPNIMTSGMETVLIPPLAILYFQSRTWQRRGLFASLLFLSRLDALALVAGHALYDLILRRRIDWREHAILLVTVVSYFALNYFFFGSPVPVSGLAKAVGNVPGENLPTGLRLLHRLLPTLIVLTPLALLRLRRNYSFRNPAALTACLIAVTASALYYGVFSGWPLWSWYLWAVMLAVYFVLVELAGIESRLTERYFVMGGPGRIIGLIVLLSHISAAFWIYHGRFWPLGERYNGVVEVEVFFERDNVLVAQALNRTDPGRTTFVMGDRAGSLGYFLDDRFRFIQLEGLVGSYEQIKAMRADMTVDYIDALSPDWLIVDRNENLQVIDGQFVVEEPYQGLSVREGAYILCFPFTARIPSSAFGSRRDTRYFFRFSARQDCSPVALDWFEEWRSKYHGPIRGDLGRLPAFMDFLGGS